MISISVIIPLYNVEKYIARCLNSLLDQTFQSFEVIIVDDFSNDSSVHIAESFKDKFNAFRIIHHDYNKGLMYARYSGYSIAQGEYFVFLDSDDFLPFNSLELYYNAIAGTHYDMIKGGFTIIDDNRCILNEYVPQNLHPKTGAQLKEDILTDKIMHNLWGAIYSRKLFEDYTYITYENQTNSEDLLLLLQLCDNINEYSILECSTYFYYENSISSSRVRFSDKSLRQYLHALKSINTNVSIDKELRERYVSKYIGALLYNNYDINTIEAFFSESINKLFNSKTLVRYHGHSKGVLLFVLFKSRLVRYLIYKLRPLLNRLRKWD